MSKTAAAVLAFVGLLLFSIPMAAQFNGLLPSGNVYAGVSYGQLTNVINKQSYRGWNASFEDLPFTEAVKRAARVFGCHPYLTEDRYRDELRRGRIRFRSGSVRDWW